MLSSEKCMELEDEYGAHNYHPIPVVFQKAEGVVVTDPEGRRYFDFLSAYSAVNQGHCHPRITAALISQAQTCTLSSRAFYNDRLGAFERKITQLLGFEMCLMMNSGAEAVETALKLARKWGYLKKKIPHDKAMILTPTGNFHGRTLAIISMSSEASSRNDFGPYMPNVGPTCPHSGESIKYNDKDSLRRAFAAHGDVMAAFLIEPIQGEAGVIVPDREYLHLLRELCTKHNVLLICDEIQSGLGRTGYMLASDYFGIKPDMLILGKALSGGVYPVSAVLASKEVMLCIKPGEHGSTYGGNPLACAVATAALDVLVEEKLCENALRLGEIFREKMRAIPCSWIKEVRGVGLLNAVEVDPKSAPRSAWTLCLLLKKNGLLAKQTHDDTIRFAPPLVITEAQLLECTKIITDAFKALETISDAEVAALDPRAHH